MGLFDRFRKRPRLTREQEKKLSLIKNENQRLAILSALEAGEDIPEYAWTPIPEDLDLSSDPDFQEVMVKINEVAEQEGRDPGDVIGDLDHGWKYEKAANTLLPFSRPSNMYLGPAAEIEPPLIRCEDSRLLAMWAFFNPMGPSFCVLTVDHVPQTDNFLLIFGIGHPFVPAYTAYGLLPESEINNKEQLLNVLQALFERNGDDDHPILIDFPTHFQFHEDALLTSEEIQSLIFEAAKTLSGQGLDHTCDLLEECKGDPWQRTAVARDEAFAPLLELRKKMPNASEKEFAAAMAKISEENDDTSFGPPSIEQLERWWRLVTDLEHVESEASQMQAAWEGAVKFQQGLRESE